MKEKWDHKKSMRENLKSLDLVYDANELLPIAVPKEVPMVRNHGCWLAKYSLIQYLGGIRYTFFYQPQTAQ